MAVHFLLIGDGPRRAGANFDQRFLHLEDDHADHLRRIIRLVEQIVEIGRDDITRTGKDTHEGCSAGKGPGRFGGSAHTF